MIGNTVWKKRKAVLLAWWYILHHFQSPGNYGNVPTMKSLFQVCFYENVVNMRLWYFGILKYGVEIFMKIIGSFLN